MNCIGCHREFINELDYKYHSNICIFFIYNNNFPNSSISNETISNIITISNLFNLNRLEKYSIFINKDDILYNLKTKLIINKSLEQNNKILIIKYISDYINNNSKNKYNYDELLLLIKSLIHIDINIIKNVISCYNICKTYL